MNEFVRIAQLQTGETGEGPGALVLVRPEVRTQVTLERHGEQQVDFRQILDDPISFFHVGNDLQMVFEDGATILVRDFFGGDTTADNLIVGDGRFIDIDQLVDIAQVQNAETIQTAAGDATSLNTALGGPVGSGGEFQSASIGGLGDGLGTSSLLGTTGDGAGGAGVTPTATDEINSLPTAGLAEEGFIDEDDLPNGTDAGSGTGTTATGSLGINFGEDGAVGRGLTFNLNGAGIPLDSSGVALDLSSDGIALVYSIVANSDGGETLTATKGVGGEVVFTVELQTFALDSGQYVFTLSGNLDNVGAGQEDEVPVSFSFTAADANGDTVGSVFQVTITDDAPIVDTAEDASVDEDDLAAGNDGSGPLTVGGDLAVSWGADDADNDGLGGATGDRTLTFDPALAGATGLTSAGDAITYVLSGDGTELTAVADQGGANERTVFTVTLDDDGTGSYEFTLSGTLDHDGAGEDGEDLTFGVIATDGDGDTADTSFTVTVVDDVPITGTAEDASVDEDDLAAGNDASKEPLVVGGDLAVSWGADDADNDGLSGAAGDRTLTFDPALAGATGLTSAGDAITYVLSGDGTELAAVADQGGANERTVFTVTLDDDGTGSYEFTLTGTLDHPDEGEDGAELTFGVVATDSDGDTIDTDFTVTVVDDVPLIGTPEAGLVDEDGLSEGNADTATGDATDADGDGDGDETTFTGDLAISWGADDGDVADGAVQDAPGGDGNRSVVFDSAIAAPADLTSNGEAVSYALSADNTVLTASAGGRTVFTVSLSDDGTGSYEFVLLDNLDHAAGGDENDIDLTFDFVATDGDGDEATASFTVTVDDDTPITGTAEDASVDEDDLAAGNDASKEPLVVGGDLAVSWGADDADNDGLGGATGDRTLTFDPALAGATGLTSAGDAITYVLSGDGTELAAVADQGGANERTVFTVTLDDDGTGSYEFTLTGTLDHPDEGEDGAELTFGVVATDSDGDTIDTDFTVTVVDDVPQAYTVDASRVLDDEAQGTFTPANTSNEVIDGPFGIQIPVPNGDVNPNYKTVSGAAGTLFSMGADGFGSIALTGPVFDVVYKDDLGFAQTESVSWDGGTVNADGSTTWTASGDNTPNAAVLTIGADGSYTFTMNAPVAHETAAPLWEENAELDFSFTVTDGDGDTSEGALSIEVDDDTPTPTLGVDVEAERMDDEAQGTFTPASDGGSFLGEDADPNVKTVSGGAGTLFSMGADGLGSINVALQGFSVVYADANGFAQTETVTWSGGVRSEGGVTTWTASGDNTPDAAVLTINADGSYTFTLNAPFAHVGPLQGDFGLEEDGVLVFAYTASDGDGDGMAGVLTVNVNDDTPVAHVVVASDQTDDEGKGAFADDSNPGAAAPSGDATDADGQISGGAGVLFTAGADGVHSVTIDSYPDISAIWDSGNGVAQIEGVTWSSGVTGDGETVWTATGDDSGQTVATLTIGNDGSYTFEQSAPLAHGADDASENDDLDLTFEFTVTDGDDDTDSGSLTVTVDDDTPVAYTVDASRVLDDEAQGTFTPANTSNEVIDGPFGIQIPVPNGDVNPNYKTVSGAAGTLFSMGADGFGSIALTGPVFDVVYKDDLGFAQTESVSWDGGTVNADGSTTWTASGDNTPNAAVLTIGADRGLTRSR